MQILVKIVFILLPFLGISQISFYKQYSDNNYDFGQGVIQLGDSSYVIAGTSGSFTGHAQAFLMHVDSNGTKLWSNHYGGQESEWGRRVLYKENYGFLLCGHSNSYSSGDYDFYMVKVDDLGVEEWSRTYGGEEWERARDAVMTRDTGAVLVGERDNGAFGMDMYIVRTNKFGDTVWTKTLENMGDDIANSIDVYQDSILYVGGNWFHADSSQTKGVIFKILDTGQILDTLLFDAYPGEYALNDLHVIGDTVQALGSNRLNVNDPWDYTFYRSNLTVNGFGNISCFNSTVNGDWYGDVFTSYGNNAKRYMAMSFQDAGSMPNGLDVNIQRGNTFMFYETSVQFLSFDEPDVNGEMIRTNDGGAILVGYHQSLLVGSGGGTVFLYKIGPEETYPTTNNPISSPLVNLNEETIALNVAVYPNPVQDRLHIELPNDKHGSFALTTISGEQLISSELWSKAELNVSGLAAGVYLLNISTNEGNATCRIVIK